MGYFDFLDQEVQESAPSVAPPVKKKLPPVTDQIRAQVGDLVKRGADQKEIDSLIGQFDWLPDPSAPIRAESERTEATDPEGTKFNLVAGTRDLTGDRAAAIENPNARQIPLKIGRNSVQEAMNANGVPEEEQLRGILDIAKQLDVDPNAPVNLGVALPRILALEGMEDVREEFSKYAESLRPTSLPYTTKGPGESTQQPSAGSEDIEREKRKLDLAELAKFDPMHNWASAISYVLLSMLIGPNLTRMIFRKGIEERTLEQQIRDRSEKIKRFQQQEDERRKLSQEDRQFQMRLRSETALRRESGALERQDEFMKQLFLTGYKSILNAKANAAKSGDKTLSQAVSKMEKSWSRAMTMARDADSQADKVAGMNPPEEQRLRKIAATWREEANKLVEMIEGLNAGSEESEEPGDESEELR